MRDDNLYEPNKNIYFQNLLIEIIFTIIIITANCYKSSLEDYSSDLGLQHHCSCGLVGKPNKADVLEVDNQKNEFPWHVGIAYIRGRPFCGGILLNDRYVLTAAHCFDNHVLKYLVVLLGEKDYTSPSPTSIRIEIMTIYVHPFYNRQEFFNDIAIVQMKYPISFDYSKIPPCIPRPELNYTGQIAIVTGWGKDKEGGKSSRVLRKIEIPILSMYKCQKAFGAYKILSSMICAGWVKGGIDSCEGDSGGPLLVDINGRWNLVGIVSWGYGCGRPNHPSVYTRVDKYYQWINNNTMNAKFCID